MKNQEEDLIGPIWEIMTVSQIAFKDITKHLRKRFPSMYKREPRADYYVVTPAMLNTKENRRLNKELGLTHINK